MEKKIKHLEFIQNIVTRMNNNSFLVKGWCVALVSAIFALAAKDANARFFLITYIAIPVFWALDSYYLSQERQYRELYKDILHRDEDDINFDLNASRYNVGNNCQIYSMISTTMLQFYVPMAFLVLVVMLLI